MNLLEKTTDEQIFDLFTKKKAEIPLQDNGGGMDFLPPTRAIGSGGNSCPECGGTGVRFENGILSKCKDCKGTGEIYDN